MHGNNCAAPVSVPVHPDSFGWVRAPREQADLVLTSCPSQQHCHPSWPLGLISHSVRKSAVIKKPFQITVLRAVLSLHKGQLAILTTLAVYFGVLCSVSCLSCILSSTGVVLPTGPYLPNLQICSSATLRFCPISGLEQKIKIPFLLAGVFGNVGCRHHQAHSMGWMPPERMALATSRVPGRSWHLGGSVTLRGCLGCMMWQGEEENFKSYWRSMDSFINTVLHIQL